MANRYLKATVDELKFRSPNSHVIPSKGRMTAEALTPAFTFSICVLFCTCLVPIIWRITRMNTMILICMKEEFVGLTGDLKKKRPTKRVHVGPYCQRVRKPCFSNLVPEPRVFGRRNKKPQPKILVQVWLCAWVKFNNGFWTCVKRVTAVNYAGSTSDFFTSLDSLKLMKRIASSGNKIDAFHKHNLMKRCSHSLYRDRILSTLSNIVNRCQEKASWILYMSKRPRFVTRPAHAVSLKDKPRERCSKPGQRSLEVVKSFI